MTEENKLFDEAFASKGGSLAAHLSDHPHTVNDILRYFTGPFEVLKKVYPNMPKINFGLIDNQHLNACAMKYKDDYYIGVYFGAYYMIKDVFRKMMGSRNVLRELGHPELETEDHKLLNISRTKQGLYYSLPPIHPPIDAVDKLRHAYSLYYAQFALDFLIIHECAHIIRGHVGYLYSINPVATFSEANYSLYSFPSDLYSFSQTIEMDADSMAVNRAFLNALHNMELDRQNGSESFPFFHDWTTFTFHWTFAIYTFFRLLGFDEYNLQKAKQYSHPPAVVRISMIAGNIATLFLERPEFKTDINVAKTVFDACVAAENALGQVSFQPNQIMEFVKQWQDEEIQKYKDDIRMNWNNVHPLLEKFAYGTLPPLAKN